MVHALVSLFNKSMPNPRLQTFSPLFLKKICNQLYKCYLLGKLFTTRQIIWAAFKNIYS